MELTEQLIERLFWLWFVAVIVYFGILLED